METNQAPMPPDASIEAFIRSLIKVLDDTRVALGISQQELAQRLGWTQSRVSRFFDPNNEMLPTMLTFIKAAKAIGCTFQVVFPLTVQHQKVEKIMEQLGRRPPQGRDN